MLFRSERTPVGLWRYFLGAVFSRSLRPQLCTITGCTWPPLRLSIRRRPSGPTHKAATVHLDCARKLLERIAFVELTPAVLERARAPFPTGLRTLDALYLVSAVYLSGLHRPLQIATYDKRLLAAAKQLGVPAFEPD